MDIETIIMKRKHYSDILKSLDTADISEKVEEKLALERERIEQEVKAEIEADKLKCQHYLAVLDELLVESADNTADISNENNDLEIGG